MEKERFALGRGKRAECVHMRKTVSLPFLMRLCELWMDVGRCCERDTVVCFCE